MNTKKLWNDGWSFLKTQLGTEYKDAMGHQFKPVDIPHDWMIYDSNNLYEDSIGWYKKTFTVAGEQLAGKLMLCFGAVYMDSTVYINGVKAYEWKYGYSTFYVDATEYVHEGLNEIVVKAVYQSPNTRWYSGAGIIRDVYLLTMDRLHIVPDGIYLRPRKNEDGTWTLKCSVELENGREAGNKKTEADGSENEAGAEATCECKVTLSIAHCGSSLFLCKKAQLGTGKNTVELSLPVEKPVLWDIEEPNLYSCTVTISCEDEVIHEEKQKVGFCTKEYLPEQGFILNGRKVRINGVCEHHDNGCLGAAFNVNAFRRKLVKLRSMGVNAIRTSHNMPAKEVLELADEMGFLVDDEAFDMWEKAKTEYDYSRFFVEWAAKDVASWVRRDRNHVSVIMWSIGNEIYDTHCDEHGQEITRRLMEYVRKDDPECNAQVTIGSNYMPWENAQKCADIVKMAGYNYAEKYYEEHHKRYTDWVIYGSETSSTVQSRGIYKFPYEQQILCDDDEQCSCLGNCTTSWGAKNTEYCITMDRDAHYSMGQFIWTGFDYIGEPTPYQTKNSYFGQLDTAGFEKDTFYIYQAEWTDYKKAPMVHIFPYWDFSDGEFIDVRVASNAPKVELFLNDRSLGTYDIDHAHGKKLLAHFKVPYEAGCLRAAAYDEEGNVIATDSRHSFGDAASLVVSPESTTMRADGRDLIYIDISAVDKDGFPVENANNRVKVKVTGAGRLVGMDNGDSTDYEQYKSDNRRMFSGELLAVIASKCEPGEIKVSVSSEGMETQTIMLEAVECEVQDGVSAIEEVKVCNDENIATSSVSEKMHEIPVRNIRLHVHGSRILGKEQPQVKIEAEILPHNATYTELIWKVTNDAGVESNCAVLEDADETAVETVEPWCTKKILTALGDGKINIRCCTGNGGEKISLISQISLTADGLGMAEFNPYEFIYGSLYTACDIEPAMGLDRGVATKRDAVSYIAFEKVNFGKNGSDEITLPIYELENKPFPIEIWKGIPNEEGSELIDRVIYDLPSKWATYQEKTFHLPKRFKGVCTISFVAEHEINIKGFVFKKYERAYDTNLALDNDSIYGDTYTIAQDAVTGIGNNVSLMYKGMNFDKGVHKVTICGRSPLLKNTIHVRFASDEGSVNQLAEFVMPEQPETEDGYVCRSFDLDNVQGIQTVNFVFLPGCNFDFKWFRFE